MDIDKLISLRNKSPVARLILDHFATRQRNTTQTTVDSLLGALQREGQEISRNDTVAIFKRLEEAGCGKFVTGRKGHPTRFEWHVPLSQVGTADTAVSQAQHDQDSEPPQQVLTEPLVHQYILRPDFTVRLTLPADITEAEASRLGDFIRTIPFT